MKIFAAIAAAIAIAATILYYSSTTGSFQLNQEIVTTRLSAVLQQKLRRRVTFDRIYYSRFEGVVVRNLRIAKRLGPGYLLTAKRLTLRVDREALSGGKLVVTGMADILQCLGTQDVPRLRIGTGPRPPQFEAKDFVLASFSSQEKKTLHVTQITQHR